jgi:hypothetical protein
MDTFGIIFTLLIIIVPVLMEVIASALKKAGKTEQAAKVEQVRKMLLSEEQKKKEALKKLKEARAEAPLPKPQPRPYVAPVSGIGQYEAPIDALLSGDITESSIKEHVETVSEKPREKFNIDKKKLIIYSEIMRPKFLGD